MKGLRSRDDRTYPPGVFRELFEPLLGEFDRLYWLLDVQSGPFSITDKPNFEKLDVELNAHWVEVPQIENTYASLWRPGIWSRFGGMLVEDEWTYLTGIPGPEAAAIESAKLFSCVPHSSPEYFGAVEAVRGVLAVILTSCWVLYTPRTDWLTRLSSDLWTATDSGDAHRWEEW